MKYEFFLCVISILTECLIKIPFLFLTDLYVDKYEYNLQ